MPTDSPRGAGPPPSTGSPPGTGPVDPAEVLSGLPLSVAHRLREQTATANAIYGIIVSCAVLASAHGQSAVALTVATFVTLMVYWTAERYAHVMAQRIVHVPLDRRELRHELSEGWELVTASFLPLAALVGGRLLGADLSQAVLAALFCGTALLMQAGWRVGRQAEFGLAGRWASAFVAGAFGVVMILLKTLPH